MTTHALTFQNTNFNIIDHLGQVWIRASELSQALGYSRSDKIGEIYRRNADEFTPSMSLTLNLGVKGFGNGESEKEVRIFSLRGCHLIAMFARTAIAKQFRKWVLDVLDKETLKSDTPYQMPLPTMSDKRTRIPLKDAVTLLVAKSRNMNYSEAYGLIHQRFDVDSVEDLTNEQIPLAVEYIHRVVGEFIGKEALPSPVAPLDFQHLDLLHGQVDYWQVRKALSVLSNIIYQYQPYSHVKPVFNIITAAESMLARLWTIIDESGIKVEILKAAAKTGKPLTEANQDTIAHLQAIMSSKVMVVQLG